MSEHGDYEKSDVHEEDVPHMHALTAFTVVVTEDGKSYAILEPPPGVVVRYEPDATAVRRACSEIVDDINCQVAAEYVISRMPKQIQAPPLPSNLVADKLAERLGRHSADAHLAHQFDDGVTDWVR